VKVLVAQQLMSRIGARIGFHQAEVNSGGRAMASQGFMVGGTWVKA